MSKHRPRHLARHVHVTEISPGSYVLSVTPFVLDAVGADRLRRWFVASLESPPEVALIRPE